MKWIGQVVHGVKTNFSNDGEIYVIADDLYIENVTQDKDIIFKTNNGGTATEVMRIDGSTSNIGIGTSSPAYTLDVAGVINTNSNYRQGGVKILGRESSNTVLEAGGDNDIVFETNDAEKVRVLSSGNVGIGTTSPSEKLHVSGNARIEGNLTVNGTYTQIDTDTSTTEQWLVTNDGTGPAAVINQKGSQDIFDVQDDGTSVFYIEDGGNVGIGTTSPLGILHTKKTASGIVGITIQNGSEFENNGAAVYFKVAGSSSDYRKGGILFVNNGTGYGRGDLYFSLNTSTSSSGIADVSSAKMTIKDSGNVGIGTTSPISSLDVNGTISLSGETENKLYKASTSPANGTTTNTTVLYGRQIDLYALDDIVLRTGISPNDDIIFFAGNSEKAIIKGTGLVGIGTSSPSEKMSVNGNIAVSNGSSFMLGGAIGDTAIGKLYNVSGVLSLDGDGTRSIRFGSTTNGEVMRVDNTNQRIGIGTSSPGQKLEVNGNAVVTGNMMLGSSASGEYITRTGSPYRLGLFTNSEERISVINGGNVGIGTTLPAASLHVASVSTDYVAKFSHSTGTGYAPGSILLEAGQSTSRGQGIFHYNTEANESWFTGVPYSTYSKKWIVANIGSETTFNPDVAQLTYALFTIDSDTGNVGIGTASPASLLHVAGTVQVGVDDTGHDVKFFGATSGKYMLWDEDNNGGTLILSDNVYFRLGNSNDLYFWHTGADTKMQNNTGDLYITNTANDKDIIFQSDDGAGGLAEYFRLDGSSTQTIFSKNQQHADNVTTYYGNAGDLSIYHDGSNSYIKHVSGASGDLIIEQSVDDADIIFKSDDGSGGVKTYFYLDGSIGATIVPDSTSLGFGTGGDMYINHDGTNTKIDNYTGDFYIRQKSADKDLLLMCDDGSGGETAYLTLDGSETRIVVAKAMRFNDSTSLQLGSDADIQMHHDGSNGFFNNITGDLTIKNSADNKDIVFQSDDGSGGVGEYFRLDGSQSDSGSDWRYTRWQDYSVLALGDGNDLQLYHAGNDSHIANYAGHFYITQTVDDGDIIFRTDDGSGGHTDYLTLDGSEGYTVANKNIRFQDNVEARFGSGNDMKLFHTGAYSMIQNLTGDLFIQNVADDKDIIFQSDDGSGGVETYFQLDGSALVTNFPDNSKLTVGGGNDLQIYHDGTYNVIKAISGHMLIKQDSNDQDIIFQCDDGSGGVETYFYLDGSQKFIITNDNIQFCVGTGQDIRLYHDGSNSSFKNYTGNFSIEALSSSGDMILTQFGDDRDIILKCDDGSGGTTAYLTLDGSEGRTNVSKDLRADDGINLSCGTSGDLNFRHDGTDSHIDNWTNDLTITNYSDDKDISFRCDDGSGGTTEYFRVDGGSENVLFSKLIKLSDNVELRAGDGNDIKIFSDGTDGYISGETGDLYIRQRGDDKDIIFQSDDGAGGTTEYLRIDGSSQAIIISKATQHGDNVKAYYGAGNDLQIFHNGSNSFIQDTGTGDLYVDAASNFFVRNYTNGEVWIKGTNGGVSLRYQDNQKIITTNTGVSVTGDVIASGNIVDGATQIKVLPHQFMSNEDGGANKSAQFRDDTIIGVRTSSDDAELYAFVEIPYGKTARTVTVYGNDTSLVVNVYESDINAGALTDKTPGAGCVVGTACDITDVAYSATNYLVIKVTTVNYTNDIVYGAVVTIG